MVSKRTFKLENDYTVTLVPVPRSAVPDDLPYVERYSKFYEVRLSARVLFWVGKEDDLRSNEFVVWYSNKSFWSGFGRSITGAINLAIRDAWLYM